MIIRDLLNLTNLALAFLAVPPAIYLTKILIEERKVIKREATPMNKILTMLVSGVAIGSLINALLSLLSLTGNGAVAHSLSPIRSVLVNAFFTFISWSFYLVYRFSQED